MASNCVSKVDPSTSTSCSFEDQSSPSPIAETAHEDEDLDYDDDSVKNSPTRQVEPDAPFESASSSKLVKQHAVPCGSPSGSSDHSKEESRPEHLTGKSTTSELDDGNMDDGESPSNSTSRIKSVINNDRVLDSLDDTKSAKRGEREESDRSHRSYDSLRRYFFKDACYFQMKSINHENVALSKSLGVWSTPIQNELRLNTAFRQHRNVILIFSVQQSGGFQGFARMVSEAGPTDKPVPWVLPARLSKKSLGGVLKVEWLCMKELPFHVTQDLYNPFNDNKPIKIARDGQQVEARVGKKLCKLFPQDSRRRLIDAVATLKKQLSHRKKIPIQVPDNKVQYRRDAPAHEDFNPAYMHQPSMPFHEHSYGYTEPNYYPPNHSMYEAPYRPMRPDPHSRFAYGYHQWDAQYFHPYPRDKRRRDFF